MYAKAYIYALVAYLLLGESAALFAVGNDTSSTFLLVTTLLGGLLMIRDLTLMHALRYEVRYRERLQR